MDCAKCQFYQALNPNHIVDSRPVKACSNGEQPGRFCGFKEVVCR